ncbi:MAG: hypothetical protein A3A12_03015 [Candidatus Staskawiczbacteria bacterium RIFCSPLOWO2_01_FULL_43_17b]|nr:MAG: hypothetical protein A3A12_03015 [Candidatus Staskawiczbacteria bacterium RIFCSPLOWO2_01_FULL_43_17b]
MPDPFVDKYLFSRETLPDIVEIRCNFLEKGCPVYLKSAVDGNPNLIQSPRFQDANGVVGSGFCVQTYEGLETFRMTMEMLVGKFIEVTRNQEEVIYWRVDYAQKKPLPIEAVTRLEKALSLEPVTFADGPGFMFNGSIEPD